MKTTYLFGWDFGHSLSILFINDFISLCFPPPGPSVPRKSVSQKLQIDFSLSASIPVQRLHPENLQKTELNISTNIDYIISTGVAKISLTRELTLG